MAVEKPIFDPREALTAVDESNCRLVVSIERKDATTPTFTIAIPTFRRLQLLRASLLSACQQNTPRPYEVLVIDNDAEDEHAEAIADLLRGASEGSTAQRVALYKNTSNVGMFGNWNRSFVLARGRWTSILNDDDMLAPDFVECIGQMADRYPDDCLLQTGFQILDGRKGDHHPVFARWHALGAHENSVPSEVSLLDLCMANDRAGSLAIAYQTVTARSIGGFDAAEFPTADYCFNSRLLNYGGAAHRIEASLAAYRIQDNESLKPEVLAGFVANDYRLRSEAASLRPGYSLLKLYARVVSIAQLHSLSRTWGVEIPVSTMRQKIGHHVVRAGVVVLLARASAFALRRTLGWIARK